LRIQLQAQLQAKEDGGMGMIIMAPNKRWSDLTARQKAPFVLRGVL